MKLYRLSLVVLMTGAFALTGCGDDARDECKDACDGTAQEIEACQAACDAIR